VEAKKNGTGCPNRQVIAKEKTPDSLGGQVKAKAQTLKKRC